MNNVLMRRPNKVREKLARGQVAVGTAIYSHSPAMVAAAGYAGIDFVRIDTEHSWRRDDSLENMINAAIIADVVPIVRVDRDDPFLVRKVLELGAGGVLIPNVSRHGTLARWWPPQNFRRWAIGAWVRFASQASGAAGIGRNGWNGAIESRSSAS